MIPLNINCCLLTPSKRLVGKQSYGAMQVYIYMKVMKQRLKHNIFSHACLSLAYTMLLSMHKGLLDVIS